MKRSVYPYIITGVLFLLAILAVFFLLILPGLISEDIVQPDLSGTPAGATDLPVDASEPPSSPDTLTVAVYDPAGLQRAGRIISQLIEDFNADNTDLSVEMTEYEHSSDLFDALKAGDGPDMFFADINYLDVDRLPEYCLDMAPLLDSDAEYSPEDFAGGACTGSFQRGFLPWVPFDFTVMSFFVQPSADTGSQELSIWQAVQLAGERGEMLFPAIWDRDILASWLKYYIAAGCIDWSSLTCQLDTPEMAALLEAIGEHPASFDDMPQDRDYLLGWVLLQSADSPSLLSHLEYEKENGGGDYEYTGLPGAGGERALLELCRCFGIFRSCDNPDGAWRFLRALLSDGAQSQSEAMPAMRSALSAALDEGASRLIVERRAAAEELFELIDGTQGICNISRHALGCIEICISQYLDGQCSAQEAAQAMQRRIDALLSERSL